MKYLIPFLTILFFSCNSIKKEENKDAIAKVKAVQFTLVADSATNDQLLKTKQIIRNRLISYGLKEFTCTIIGRKIIVTVSDSTNQDYKPLLTSNGNFSVQVSGNHEDIETGLKKWVKTFPKDSSILSKFSRSEYPTSVGYVSLPDTQNFYSLLEERKTTLFRKDISFLWDYKAMHSKAIELNAIERSPLAITGDFIESSEIKRIEAEERNELFLSFSKEGTSLLEKLTGWAQYVAFILDNKVLSSARIMDPIKGGNISIVGIFSEEDFNFFQAILSTPSLSTGIKMVEEKIVEIDK